MPRTAALRHSRTSRRRKGRRKPSIWSEAERRAWALPTSLTVSEWAEEHRILDEKTSAEPGRWHNDRTPYLAEVMDSFNDPAVQDITLMFCTQVGKTESELNILAYIMAEDPGPTLWVMPTIPIAKRFSYGRAKPMIDLCAPLAEQKPRLSDDMTKTEFRFDRMTVRFCGSNSPGDLASDPIRFLIVDETDKYPPFAGREADPIKLAAQRQSTFWNRKTVRSSSPTTRSGYIWREYDASDQRKFYVPCPACGHWQLLGWPNVKFPAERTADEIKTQRLAWYECPECGAHIDDAAKPRMLRQSKWVPGGCHIQPDGTIHGHPRVRSHRGYWLNALYSPWLSWSDVAAEFIQSKDNPALLMNFVNSWLAEVWEEKTEQITANVLVQRQDGRSAGIVPDAAIVITAGVDVQLSTLYYVVRAWGLNWENWLVRAGRLETFAELEAYLFLTEYPVGSWSEDHWQIDQNRQSLGVRMACIDARYRKDEVHACVRRWRDVARAILGRDHLQGQLYTMTMLDKDQAGGAIKGGRQAWHIDTSVFKDRLSRLINAEPEDPGQFHLCNELPYGYFDQMSSEHKRVLRNRRTLRATEEWQPVTMGAANHYWDCEVYAAAAADMIHVAAFRPGTKPVVYRPKAAQAAPTPGPKKLRDEDSGRPRDRPGPWLQRRKGWLKR